LASTELAVELGRLLSPDRVLTGAALDAYAVDGLRPSFALQPEAISEVSAVLHFANERGLAVAPSGGGTEMGLGNKPARYDLALDLRRLNTVIDFSPEDLVVTTQAGISVAALNKTLEARGQFLALDVPQPELATIGGALSANITGPRRLRYGTARDLVIGLTCVLANGETVHSGGRVVKNVAGYDLNKLYLGALGTLGVIVEATFKLHPLPAATTILTARFPSCETAHAAALAAVNSNLSPAAVELCDPGLAQFWLDRDEGSGWLLALLASGLPAAVVRQRQELAELARAAGAISITEEEPEAGAALFRRIRDCGRGPQRAAAMLLRCAVRPNDIAGAIAQLQALPDARSAGILASTGAGVIRLFWAEPPDSAAPLVAAARAALAPWSGAVTVERCPVEAKDAIEIWGISGPDVALMRDLKAAFDANGILNPGRFVDRL
jgi:glycolate oxidase FAD binding subunit